MAIDRRGAKTNKKKAPAKKKPAQNSRGNERRGSSTKVQKKKNKNGKASRLNTQEKVSSKKQQNTMVKSGALAARENPVNIARSGAQNYIIKDKAQTAVTTPAKVASGVLKNTQNGVIRTAGGGNTRGNERLTNDKQKAHYQSNIQKEKDRREAIDKRKKAHEKNGYKYGDKFIKAADKFTDKVNKELEKGKALDLEYGASVLSDKKHDVPIYTKWAKGKAKNEARTTLKENDVTQASGKKVVDDWIKETESKWGKDGYDVKDDTVVTEDGKTWGEIKKDAYDQQAQHIKNIRKDYINKATRNAGKMSAQDIYKAGVPMASEFIDYGIPYMATAKGSIKVAEKLLAKATKAGKTAGKASATVPKIEKAVSKLVDDGTLTPEAAKAFNKKIALKSGAKSFSTELVANALQDATIGTTIDLAKGIGEGLKGKELEDYMIKNAEMNFALGIPMSGIAGRMGAKEAKKAMAMDYAKAINDVTTNLSKAEGIELENLMKKSEKGVLGAKETEKLTELQNKALGGGEAVVNSKGKIEVNKAETIADEMTPAEAKEYINLRAKQANGTLKIDSLTGKNDVARLAQLEEKAKTAYRKAEVKAENTINIKGKKITSMLQENAESAVRFYERTGDKTKLKQAQEVLEKAKKATQEKNISIENNLKKMEDITQGNYRWVDGDEMEALSGNRYNGGYYDPNTGEIIVNRDSPQAYQTVIGHETMHMLKSANPEGFDKLSEMLTNYVKELGDYDDLFAEVKRAYPEYANKFDAESKANLDEEMVSEMLGRYVFGEDDTFIKKMAGEDPTLLQKIIAYLKQLFGESPNKELVEQFSKLEKTALDEIKKIKLAENGEEVWAVRITDEMRESIKKKGQKRWSKFGTEGATGAQKALGEKAEAMFKDGVAPEEIFMKTGWVVDTDGKAKMRFSDEGMSLNYKMSDLRESASKSLETAMKKLDDIESALKRTTDDAEIRRLMQEQFDAYDELDAASFGMKQYKLGDLINHEELFKHYPDFKNDVTVQFAPKSYFGDGSDGLAIDHHDGTYTIVIQKSLKKNDMLDDIVHEMQHIIQYKEGFSQGATPEIWASKIKDLRTRMKDASGDELKKLQEQYDKLTADYRNTPENVKDKLVEDGKIPYYHTKGEWEARQAEAERNMSPEEMKAQDEAEVRGTKPELKDKHEVKIEDYEEFGKKMSKLGADDVATAREKYNATKSEIASIDEKFGGKLTAKRRKELEERRKTLEEQLEQERLEVNELNKPVYKKNLEQAKKKLKELESRKVKAKGKELDDINRQITNTKRNITRNENLIKNEPKTYVSDTPVKELTDEALKKEYNSVQKTLRDGKGKSILAREAREERLSALREEAEKRGIEVRGNIERADELIKEKGFGWQEAKKLKNEINDLDKQIAELNKGKLTMKKADEIRELQSERTQKNTRLSQVLDNSKSVVPEGKSAIEAFDEIVGGNTLKEAKINKMGARKLIEENGSLKGARDDAWHTIRRKTESSLIEYELAGKQLIKDGQKELGQALLDQTNNVVVYKNKAAAAVETHRASADGTKVGESLNDIFKVKDKNDKVVDLLLAENAKMRTDLSNYLFAKHSFAREVQGKKVFGLIDEDGKPKWTNKSTQEFMDAIVEKYGEKTVNSFERGIRDYIDYLNEYRLDTGLISKELLDKLNDIYPYYIPTNRSVANKPPTEYELPKNTAEVENGIKKAVGGDAPLEDLYTQLVKMTMATIRSGEQNKMLAMYAKAYDIEPTRLPKDATADDVLESSVTAFDSNHQGKWKVRFYQNGEAVTIPVNRHAAKGLREFNGQDYATLIAVSAKAGKILHMREYKGFITDWNLVFGVRNGMRDSQQALVNSKDTRWYTKSLPRAMAAIADENNAFRILYDANGGRYSTLQQINRLDEIGALNKKGGTVAKGLEKIEDINGMIEMKPRMQEFIGTIQKEADRILGKKGVQGLLGEIEAEAKLLPDGQKTAWIEREYAQRIVDIIKKEKPDIIATAIRNSSDITVNFSRSGVVTKALNAGFVPYLNPSVQGLSKMMRMFTESKAQGFGKLACFGAKLSVLTIAPSMLNEIMCKDNEAYQRINSRDKDNAFFIPMSWFGGDKDKFIKIPKPRENAVLAEPFEYGIRCFFDNAQYGTPEEFTQMFLSARDNIGIVSVWNDNIVAPLVKTGLNKTWYGADILSEQELENVKNEEAWKNFDETTSWFGKEIGKMANISPKKVDTIMDSYFGLIFDFGISQTSQKNINDVYSSPKNFLKGNPFVQQFMKDSVFSNKYAVQFWDKVDKLNEGHDGAKSTIQKREFMAKYGYDTFTYDTAISNIDNDESIPKTEKIEMKRELRKYKNQLMQRALEDKEVLYDPMQRIINLYKKHGVKNATDVCLSTYADGDHAEAYKHLKQSKEYRDATPAEKREWQRKFLNVYKDVKKIARFTGDSDKFVNYSTVEYVCAKRGYTKGHIANMYAWKSKEYSVEKGLKDMKKYIDDGYTEKNFKITMRALNRGAEELNDEDKQYASKLEDYNKAMINAERGHRDGAFLVSSPYMGEARMNAARCLTDGHSGKDFKWTDKRINNFCKKYDITHDKNYKYDNEQVAKAVKEEYKDKTPEEQAAVYVVITGDTEGNPFGDIGDYSHDNDTGILKDEDKGRGGRGRGRRGHRGGGGGGGSKGAMPKTKSGAFDAKITDPYKQSKQNGKSNLDEAYRKKVRKLRQKQH